MAARAGGARAASAPSRQHGGARGDGHGSLLPPRRLQQSLCLRLAACAPHCAPVLWARAGGTATCGSSRSWGDACASGR
eukprot:1191496-Prorocentrum_minimum.AAC.1